MTDRDDLLDNLKIDRTEVTKSNKHLWWLLVIAMIATAGLIAWYFLTRETIPTVQTVLVKQASPRVTEGSVLNTSGYVVARRQATVSSRIAGRVESVLVEEGMEVEKGQLLATLDADLRKAQFEVAEAQLSAQRSNLEDLLLQLTKAKIDLDRNEQLWQQKFVDRDSVDTAQLLVDSFEARIAAQSRNIEVAEKNLELETEALSDYDIVAPFAGVVVAKAAQPGEMIAPVAGGGFTRTGICTIVDMESLEVEIDVSESMISRVKPEQQVTVGLTAVPDVRLPGEVIAIIPTADRARSTVRVRIGFIERDERVLPDMGVQVAFLEEGEQAQREEVLAGLIVPESAVFYSGDDPQVWALIDDMLEQRPIKILESDGTTVRVDDGIRVGERVVINLDNPEYPPLAEGLVVQVAPQAT